MTDPGFHYSVLSEFRARLVAQGVEQQLLDTLLAVCQAHGWVRAGGTQRTDATQVLGAIRAMNRLESVGETLRAALNALAVAAPTWLRAQIDPDWGDRYSRRVEEYRLPKGDPARQAYANCIGLDGTRLLRAIYAPAAPVWLRHIPAVEILRRVWLQQCSVYPVKGRKDVWAEHGAGASQVRSSRWASADNSASRASLWALPMMSSSQPGPTLQIMPTVSPPLHWPASRSQSARPAAPHPAGPSGWCDPARHTVAAYRRG